MDRARRLIALAIAAAAAGCGGAAARPLAPGQTAPGAPAGLAIRTRAATGVLAYRVALDRAGSRLVTVELATAFELVARRLGPRGEVVATRRIALGPADYDIRDLAVDAAGERAYVASADGSVREIDLARGAVATTWRLGDVATAVAVSRDGGLVATGSRGGVICVRRQSDGALLHCLLAHTAAVSSIDFSTDRLATAGWDGQVKLWRLPSLAAESTHRVVGSANDVAFSPDGSALAVAISADPPVPRRGSAGPEQGDPGGSVEVIDTRRVLRCRGHTGPVTAVAWTPDGQAVISAGWDGSIRLWHAGSGHEIDRIDGLAQFVRDVASASRGGRAAAAAWALDADEASSLLLDLLYTAPRGLP